MKCVIKRPKIILNSVLEKNKYFIIKFTAKLFNKNKKEFNLLNLCVGEIEEVKKNIFNSENLIPFYRRNNLTIAFVKVDILPSLQKKSFLLIVKNNKIVSNYESYLQVSIIDNDFSLKIKHIFTNFFQNRYNQYNH